MRHSMTSTLYVFLTLAAVARCGADAVVVTKPQSAEPGTPAILSAQLAVLGADLPLCEGMNDALPVTFSYPLAVEPSPESFTVRVGNSSIEPNCATLAPAEEENERQTVLLLGNFQTTDTFQPMQVSIRDISFDVNGSTVPLISDDECASPGLSHRHCSKRSMLLQPVIQRAARGSQCHTCMANRLVTTKKHHR